MYIWGCVQSTNKTFAEVVEDATIVESFSEAGVVGQKTRRNLVSKHVSCAHIDKVV
jgi:hypothetical protein